MSYYHDLITAKSWELLQTLLHSTKFTLIGGWAVYLFTKTLKSKDIDIVVDYPELDRLRQNHEMQKNDRLKKYEIHMEGIDVDIYVPFFSDLGVPVEKIGAHTTSIEGFQIPEKELLLILKQKAWQERGQRLKGEKDRIDIIALIQSGCDWKKYKTFLQEFGLPTYQDSLIQLLSSVSSIPELQLNAHQYSRLKKGALASLKS